jgi:hypothetical protein
MNEELIKELVELAVSLAMVAIAPFLIRYINAASGEKKLAAMQKLVEATVATAETQLSQSTGEEKLQWVTTRVEANAKNMGYKVSPEQISTFIEYNVYVLNLLAQKHMTGKQPRPGSRGVSSQGVSSPTDRTPDNYRRQQSEPVQIKLD